MDIFHIFFTVFIVNFEQVNVNWAFVEKTLVRSATLRSLVINRINVTG